ncbi:hypothetical protein [Amycolatopsis sp. NPDC003861]
MTGRQVRLHHDVRIVSIVVDRTREELRYPGITIQCIDDGAVVEQTWIPLGVAATDADDEALLTAWHVALRWSQSPTDTPST